MSDAAQRRIAELELEVASLRQQHSGRQRIASMSAEVVANNPYSRLLALKTMGIVPNYEDIRQKTVCVVGIGGVGAVVAECLTRCGIGKLLLFDLDTVELSNMNRLFYRPDQVGMTKTHAAQSTLSVINPDVVIEAFTFDITTSANFERFLTALKSGGLAGDTPVDLVCGCVDNFAARMSINQACLELDQVWFESGVSENAISGHIQLMQPGVTACFACCPPLAIVGDIDEATLKRANVCAASLPTTMTLVAVLLAQNALKLLLGFGQVSRYVGYSALSDFFPRDELRPSLECANNVCRQRQLEHANDAPNVNCEATATTENVVDHGDNEWGIRVLETQSDTAAATSDVESGNATVTVDATADVASLARQLKALKKN